MEQFLEFLQSHWVQSIGVSLWMLLEFWLGKTEVIKPGSTLEVVLSGAKRVLELFGLKKKQEEPSIKPKDK